MTGKWTPGPWKWSGPDYEKEHEPPESCASYALYSTSTKHEDAVLSGCGNCGNIFYNEANGHLIAAAPDILSALERMAGLWSKWAFVSDDGALAQARAAIARAKGEAP